MNHETVLPKNIRQIGEIQQDKKVYLEDYVMTLIRKKEKELPEGCAGILTGCKEEDGENTYVFIKGAILLETDSDADGCWEKMEEERKQYFADQEIAGYFVLGTMEEERLGEFMSRLPGFPVVLFHMQEGEETVYWSEEKQYERLKGYFIFYERNPQMQKYIAEQEKPPKVEGEEGSSDKAIVSFREKIREKGRGKKAGGLRYLASSFLILTILFLGVTIINNYDRMKNMEEVISQISLEQQGQTGISCQVSAEGQVENSAGQAGEDGQSSTGQTGENGESQDGTGQTGESSKTETVIGQTSVILEAEGEATTEAEVQTKDSSETMAGTSSQNTASNSQRTTEAVQTTANAAVSDGVREVNGEAAAVNAGGTGDSLSVTVPEGETEAVLSTASSGLVLPDTGTSISSQALAERNYSAENADAVDDAALNKTDEILQSASRQTQSAYTVKYGDTLADISVKYYGSLAKVEEICRLNQIEDANLIVPGQKIVLP